MVKKVGIFIKFLIGLLVAVLFIVFSMALVMSNITTSEEESEKQRQSTIDFWVEQDLAFQKEKSALIKNKDVLLEHFTVDEVELGQAVIDEIITSDMNEYQRVKAVYDYITANVDYDYEAYLNEDYAGPEHQAPIGALRDGTAVCGGFARTMELLCILADVDCIFVNGLAGIEGYRDPEESRHAWNKVKIDDKWYNVDVTWDESGNHGKYYYFLVSDERFYIDHEVAKPLVYYIPESPEEY